MFKYKINMLYIIIIILLLAKKYQFVFIAIYFKDVNKLIL